MPPAEQNAIYLPAEGGETDSPSDIQFIMQVRIPANKLVVIFTELDCRLTGPELGTHK